jgi:2-methylcitrate dehydratase PrpD
MPPLLTKDLAQWITHSPTGGSRAMTAARHALLDWLGVTLAGAHKKPVEILSNDLMADNPTGQASILGRNARTAAPVAALINGTASHALDYDDINKHMRGHPSVTVIPAAFAMAEILNSSGEDLLDAIIVGTEVACYCGTILGASHYQAGWHTTATAGTFGATAATARLLKLDAYQTEMALGLAATQAAGLKNVFGSMAKALHAGKAAMNGLLSARWARAGFESVENTLEAAYGFGPVFSPDFNQSCTYVLPGKTYAIETNIYKYHAACYYTHSAIEALRNLLSKERVNPDQIEKIRVGIPQQHLNVINIIKPMSGLELKFSISFLLAMVALNIDTSNPTIFTKKTVTRSDIIEMAGKVEVVGDQFTSRTEAKLSLLTTVGAEYSHACDVGIPEKDLDHQAELLEAKFKNLCLPFLDEKTISKLSALIRNIEQSKSVREISQTAILS